MAIPVIDSLLDVTVVPGFSRIGYEVRSRSRGWAPIASFDLTGATAVVTGVTSGIGAAAARQLRSLGADLVVVGRDPARTDAAAGALRDLPGAGTVEAEYADLAELDQVRAAAAHIARRRRIDVLVHNAGALLREHSVTSAGTEVTIAAQVLGPFLLTSLLLPRLRSHRGRVVTVASGGMYAAALPDLGHGGSLKMAPAAYDGTRQYAIAKRAQVTLNELWAEHEPDVHFHCMHPGWADTPGVASSLPMFRRITRPVLRTSDQGADTVVWLAASPDGASSSGRFWCDRAVRPTHRLPTTRRADTPAARTALWDWCTTHTAA
jgi:NAD(P)-dependent dehydrogenase (short-subunit alcohol dehydrogenase family)